MRIILSASACLLSLFVAACGDSGGSGGGSGGNGTTATGGSGGDTATGGTTTGGSGGTGGSTSTGGTGGSTGGTGGTTATGGTGGMTSTGAAFGEPCTMDTDCVEGLLCFNFQAKGMLCTKECQSAADCPAPSSGCNGMGYCKPN